LLPQELCESLAAAAAAADSVCSARPALVSVMNMQMGVLFELVAVDAARHRVADNVTDMHVPLQSCALHAMTAITDRGWTHQRFYVSV